MIEGYGDQFGNIASKIRRMFLDHGIDIETESYGNELSLSTEGISECRLALSGEELVIDYIASERSGVGRRVVEVLIAFADEYGHSLRASCVSEENAEFWESLDFMEDGQDFIYEPK